MTKETKGKLEILHTDVAGVGVIAIFTRNGVEEEEHDLIGKTTEELEDEAMMIWGLDRDSIEIVHIKGTKEMTLKPYGEIGGVKIYEAWEGEKLIGFTTDKTSGLYITPAEAIQAGFDTK